MSIFAKTTSWKHRIMDFPSSFTKQFAKRRGAVVHTDAGSLINVGHGKFILILRCINDLIGYCVINSERYNFDPESKVEIEINDQPVITKGDCPALKKDKSYVNCGNVGLIEVSEFDAKIESGAFRYVGSVEAEKLRTILARGLACKVLKPFQIEYFKPDESA